LKSRLLLSLFFFFCTQTDESLPLSKPAKILRAFLIDGWSCRRMAGPMSLVACLWQPGCNVNAFGQLFLRPRESNGGTAQHRTAGSQKLLIEAGHERYGSAKLKNEGAGSQGLKGVFSTRVIGAGAKLGGPPAFGAGPNQPELLAAGTPGGFDQAARGCRTWRRQRPWPNGFSEG